MKIRKLLTLFLSVTMLSAMIAAFPAEAAGVHVIPEGNTLGTFDGTWNGEIIEYNGILPTVAEDIGVPSGWKLTKTKQNAEKTALDFERVAGHTGAEGDWAIKLNNEDGTSKERTLLELVDTSAFVPGMTYKISYWAMGTVASFNGIKMTFSEADPYNQTYVGYRNSAVQKNVWTKIEELVTVPADTDSVIMNIDAAGTPMSIDDISILCMGVSEESEEDLIGEATADWRLDGATLSEGTLSLPVEGQASYTVSLPDEISSAYVFSANATVVADGDLRIDIDTFDAEGVALQNLSGSGKERDFFFNRYVDYTYTFCAGEGKVKFSLYPADKAKSIKLTFINMSESNAVSLNTVSLTSTDELISDGSFESLPVYKKYVGNTEYTSSSMPGWYVTNTAISVGSAAVGDGTNNFRLMQPVRVEAGSSYRLSYEVNSENGVKLGADWFIDTQTAIPAQPSMSMAVAEVTTGKWVKFSTIITVPTQYTLTVDKVETDVEFETEEIVLRFREHYSGKFKGQIRNISFTKIPVFFDDNGNAVTELVNGKTYYAVLEHVPTTGTDATAVVALYDVSGTAPRLVDFKLKTTSKLTGDTKAYSLGASLTVPENGKYAISAFCIDSIGGLSALGQKYTLQ